MTKRQKQGPRVLVFDVETAPILAHVWKLWDENVGLNQVRRDWHLLSWAAKWLDDPPTKVMYQDQRRAAKVGDDKKLLRGIWKLLDQADIVITQNGKSFDAKVLNARFVLNGMKPPSSYRHIDTRLIAKKFFRFTSTKLEYMSDKICKKYKKLKHTKYPGHEMWVECLAGNQDAWREMEKYNKYDVLALEELYGVLRAWDTSLNFGVYSEDEGHVCSCGSKSFKKQGWFYTSIGKYQRWGCKKCGAETRDRVNMLPLSKRKSMRVGTQR